LIILAYAFARTTLFLSNFAISSTLEIKQISTNTAIPDLFKIPSFFRGVSDSEITRLFLVPRISQVTSRISTAKALLLAEALSKITHSEPFAPGFAEAFK